MDELIKPAVEAVKNGEVKLIPERMDKTYFNWTDNIRDWCISRQLWWGHRGCRIMSMMAKVYADLIRKGKKTVKDVPKSLQKEVKALLAGDTK